MENNANGRPWKPRAVTLASSFCYCNNDQGSVDKPVNSVVGTATQVGKIFNTELGCTVNHWNRQPTPLTAPKQHCEVLVLVLV